MGFQGNDDIIIIHLFQNMNMPPGCFHQSFCRRMAVFFQQVFGQGTCIDSDPDGHLPFPGGGHHFFHSIPSPDVPRIQPQSIHSAFQGRQSQPVIEMDIRHQRDGDLIPDFLQGLGRFQSGHGATDDFTAPFRQPMDLFHRGRDIFCFSIGHRLDGHRIPSSDGHSPASSSFHTCGSPPTAADHAW